MSDGMRRELVYLSSYATNRYFIPNWGIQMEWSCFCNHAALVSRQDWDTNVRIAI